MGGLWSELNDMTPTLGPVTAARDPIGVIGDVQVIADERAKCTTPNTRLVFLVAHGAVIASRRVGVKSFAVHHTIPKPVSPGVESFPLGGMVLVVRRRYVSDDARRSPRGQHLVLFPCGEDSAAHDGYLGNPKAWLPNETLGAAG